MGKHEGAGQSFLSDIGLLATRLTVGGLLAGHGAQKLFGAFKGQGLEATGGFMESLGLKPGKPWAALAGGTEFMGGLLTATGLLGPVGPITAVAPMAMATGTVHANKPIWGHEGGPELPVINIAVMSGLALAGPGRLSLDSLFGIKLHWSLPLLGAAATGAGIAFALSKTRAHQAAQTDQSAGGESAAGTPAETGRSESAQQRDGSRQDSRDAGMSTAQPAENGHHAPSPTR